MKYLLCILFLFTVPLTQAQSLLCLAKKASVKNGKAKTSKLIRVVTTPTCPSGYSQVLSTSTFTGSPGVPGENGSDGQLRIYGNGSAGALNITDPITSISDANLQFTSCTIQSGAVLIVPSGAILRCDGNVIISGFISVQDAATGGLVGSSPSTNVYTSMGRYANPGRTRTVAANGEMGSNSASLSGGTFSFNMGNEEAMMTYQPHIFGGGGGGGSAGFGGNGGGYFAILASGTITVTGGINAVGGNGSAGGGGGGGGFVVLASKTGVTIPSSASINVQGGNGGSSGTSNGAGGGGGGGLVYVISPNNSVNTSGFNLSGGLAGDNSTSVSTNVAIAGGAGGGSVGAGGSGGSIPSGVRPTVSSAGTDGSIGFNITLTADPTALF